MLKCSCATAHKNENEQRNSDSGPERKQIRFCSGSSEVYRVTSSDRAEICAARNYTWGIPAGWQTLWLAVQT